jgi:hypothetical protein
MAEITLTSLHDDILALRHDIVRLESKIDTKPGLMAMFTGILVTVLGMAGVIASTITALHALGFIK